ncbi:MAG: 2-C-methyl-D-erythritol 4-phosphate cytidylyltransferase, partial [Clostridiales Family XIII bacterium]|nr:2-C-methyl-D-erythritol 4-phosphate cytidylyltransferase [Clostridiales Family XIII bacterium]
MYRDKRVAVIIAAAGAGLRMGADLPKQFMRIGDRSVLARSTEAFERNASVDDIYLVAEKGRAKVCRAALGGPVAKLRGICAGGATRQASVFAGLSALPEAVDLVLIHDAVRPFVSQACIDRVLRCAAEKGAAAAATPVKDTIKAARDGVFTKTLDRSALYGIQTPQAFLRPLLCAAYAAAIRDGFTGTDDAVLLERIGEKVYLTEGDYDNIKLTTPEDVIAAQAIADFFPYSRSFLRRESHVPYQQRDVALRHFGTPRPQLRQRAEFGIFAAHLHPLPPQGAHALIVDRQPPAQQGERHSVIFPRKAGENHHVGLPQPEDWGR